MTRDRQGWPDDEAAERLLRGEPGDGAGAEAQALARLLAAAARPRPPHSCHGEQAALAAFRVARSESRARWRRGPLSARAVIGVAVAGLAFGGAALAVGTVSFGDRPDSGPGQPPSASGAAEPGHRPHPSAGKGNNRTGPGRDPGDPPELDALCRSYAERASDKGLDSNLLARLVSEAGGKDKVRDYCADRLSAEGGGDRKGKGGKPKDRPGVGNANSGGNGNANSGGNNGNANDGGNNGNANSGGNGYANSGGNNGNANSGGNNSNANDGGNNPNSGGNGYANSGDNGSGHTGPARPSKPPRSGPARNPGHAQQAGRRLPPSHTGHPGRSQAHGHGHARAKGPRGRAYGSGSHYTAPNDRSAR